MNEGLLETLIVKSGTRAYSQKAGVKIRKHGFQRRDLWRIHYIWLLLLVGMFITWDVGSRRDYSRSSRHLVSAV